ncbi:hypothetical protein JD79_04369 [Geodermatophilus normandii]|uniref:Uncharacterized protein n=2 Tax=Geodermatophilus normandii TaxID=1137989 RepID=A0A317QQQ7_9ACTN|nr:hypothetical protein JD79_04369 [Geodermatophilus normandii]
MQSLIQERLCVGRAGEVERRDDELKQRDARHERAGLVARFRGRQEIAYIVAPKQPGRHCLLRPSVQYLHIDAFLIRHKHSVAEQISTSKP